MAATEFSEDGKYNTFYFNSEAGALGKLDQFSFKTEQCPHPPPFKAVLSRLHKSVTTNPPNSSVLSSPNTGQKLPTFLVNKPVIGC